MEASSHSPSHGDNAPRAVDPDPSPRRLSCGAHDAMQTLPSVQTAMTETVVWRSHPRAPAPVQAILRARRSGSCRVEDDHGREVACGPARLLYEGARAAILRIGGAAIGLLARACCPRRSPPIRRDGADPSGPVVLVVPVLPDVSHTFVYREVLALLDARPDWRCVALAAEARAPQHPEAIALMQRSVFLPRTGVFLRLARMLRWLCTSRGRELFSLYRASEGGSVAALLHKRAIADARDPGNAFELADLLRGMRPRHVHVYSSTHPTNVAMGAAHLLAVPFSISSYVDFEFDYSHKLLAEKFARATFFRVVTQFCARALVATLGASCEPSRVAVVYLGLDLENWSERAPLAGRGVFVSAARFVEKKGLRYVPAAIKALRERGITVRWRLVGDGPEREAIHAEVVAAGVADLVDFLGPLDSAAMRRELLAADAAVLPCVVAQDGERDGIPIFLNEAMALGVPVVTTSVSGIPEMVRDGETGFLCEPRDSRGLADALLRALTDRAVASRVGANARELVRAQLDVRATSAQLLARIDA